METVVGEGFVEPFPHLIIKNFYNEDELQLIWEELKFFTKPDKLINPEVFTPKYGGKEIVTNATAYFFSSDSETSIFVFNVLSIFLKRSLALP